MQSAAILLITAMMAPATKKHNQGRGAYRCSSVILYVCQSLVHFNSPFIAGKVMKLSGLKNVLMHAGLEDGRGHRFMDGEVDTGTSQKGVLIVFFKF